MVIVIVIVIITVIVIAIVVEIAIIIVLKREASLVTGVELPCNHFFLEPNYRMIETCN